MVKRKSLESKKISAKNSKGNKNSLYQIKKDMLDERSKQSKLVNQIKDDIKKIRESNMSITGLEQISSKSIERLQEKRQKSMEHMTMAVKDLNILIGNITKLESKYKQTMQ